jgi:peptide/nickel transport system substrate-binding protein
MMASRRDETSHLPDKLVSSPSWPKDDQGRHPRPRHAIAASTHFAAQEDRVMTTRINRRELLAGISVASAGALVTASIAAAHPGSVSERAWLLALQEGTGESPQLTERVDAGELPPVAERLPAEPLALESEAIGTYGGDWNLSLLKAGAASYLNTTIGYENLVRWSPAGVNLTVDEVIPNVAASYDVDETGAVFTFHLREGMKWSDGEPFTADDLLFWYEDVLMNKEITSAVEPWLTTGKKPVTVTKTDDLTVVFTFESPAGLFLVNLATQRGGGMTNHPAHYMRQFHKTHTPAVEQQAKDAELEGWVALYNLRANEWENPEKPVLNAWQLTGALGKEAQVLEAVRNPYYWKVDAEGNQLPYLDRVVYTRVENEEVAVLRVLNGEVDMVDQAINEFRNKPVYFENQEKGDFRFFDTVPQQMNQMVLMLNMTHTDKAKRDVFANKDFRVGLSHALNRQEIIDVVYVSQGEPWQAAPRPESTFFHETLAKQFTEFDVDLANQHLDKVLPEKNGDGARLGASGEPFFFQVEVSSLDPDYASVLELVVQYWQAVGISATFKVEDQELFATRTAGNQHDACVSRGGGGLGVMMDPFYYFPYNFNARYAVPWVNWFINPEGDNVIEPPAVVQEQITLYRQVEATIDPEEQHALMMQILDIAVEQFWCLGISLRSEEYGIFKNTLKNTPATSVTGWLHADLAPSNPQQYFRAGT